MDVWEKSMREDHKSRNRRENPSFSSTLLDAIYRSIDESNGGKGDDHHPDHQEELIFYKEKTMRKKHSGNIEEEEEMESMRRACLVERWMEKKTSCEKVVVRRKSMADFERKKLIPPRNELLLNSSSSSSDSSCGGGFSSSESDSFYVNNVKKERSKSNSSSCYSMQRPKPIRTSISTGQPQRYEKVFHQAIQCADSFQQKPTKKSHENGFVKTKSKALKIYSDLKKVKQPISPGGRLASFLNSLFTAGNAKKAKISSSSNNAYDSSRKPEHESISTTCSTASSFSRSCLSNTPSSRGKLSSNNGMKRSVRFYPVSVIVDEDCRPCGHKNLYENDHNHHVLSENRRVAEAARELLKSYQKNNKEEFDHHDHHMMIRDICDVNGRLDVEVEDDDGEEDAASCASSDLFELDSIGIERYREELPVYETTHLDTNRAIASGLIL
ncbi:hypothetical protein JRO89_XS09G0225800 [Xanthoceras sorbifolium]|uniref:Protein BIG GRAIN 1-like A n=1 Tax=Xanthoceras sorbifolium TaxID=99658 RepID=A0ABQ8HMH5_9ROSI|nr:hypothetical protein JRO89_XS09G0225800 [Xanthoceras sorbifolium]